VLPKIQSHPRYQTYLDERIQRYEKFSNIAYDILKDVKGLQVNRTNGAFYMSAAFQEGVLNHEQTLPIELEGVRKSVEELVAGPDVAPDKRFVYYLLASTGVCVVPLSSFATDLQGFRITLLERDEQEFTKIFTTIAESIKKYLASV
jgi:aspartate/methionine/tyrosine aminotransferase